MFKNIITYSLLFALMFIGCDSNNNEFITNNNIKVYDNKENHLGDFNLLDSTLILDFNARPKIDTVIIDKTVTKKEVIYRNNNGSSFKNNIFQDGPIVISYSSYGNVNVNKESKGVYKITIGESAYINSISVLGSPKGLDNKNELTVKIDNSLNDYSRTFMVQIFDVNNGSLFNGEKYGVIPNQKIKYNLTTIMIPGLQGFSDLGYLIELR